MKDLYDITRHLVWMTQFGLSVCLPPVLCTVAAVWLRDRFALGGRVVAVGVVLGILGAVGSLRSCLKAIERQGKDRTDRRPPSTYFNHH